jgi:aryl-alcohol dehydrogenase-like predicted oxidoreductase
MRYAAPVLERCARAAEAFGLTQKQLALRFALSLPGVDSLVLGCRDEGQLRDNCRELAEARPLSEAQMEQLRIWFSDTPREISLPMLWPRD